MNLFKRISATVVSQLDEAVRGIENHDAVVGVSLGDLRRAIAEARVRQRRICAGIDQQHRRRNELAAEATTWRGRALDSDERTALDCLRRARACDREVGVLDRSLEQQRAARERMDQARDKLDRRHRELEAHRQTLRGREAAARADRTAECAGTTDAESLQQTLDRWDIDITEHELAATAAADHDDLAQRFKAAEEESELRTELAALRNEAPEE